MDIIVKADTNLIDFIQSTANVLTFNYCNYFYLGSQVIMYDPNTKQYSVITEFEYSQLHKEIKLWIYQCTSQLLNNLIS